MLTAVLFIITRIWTQPRCSSMTEWYIHTVESYETTKRNYWYTWVSHVALVVKNPPANAGDAREAGSIPGPERFPGGGNGTPLQYPGLEIFMGRRAWWAIVHGLQRVGHS